MSYPPQPPAPGSPFAPGPPAIRRRNTLGLVAAILVGACLVLEVIASISTTAIIASRDADYAAYGAVALLFSILEGLIATAAIVLGAIGLAGRDTPKALAGIGLGGGIAVLFGILVGQLTNALLIAFSS